MIVSCGTPKTENAAPVAATKPSVENKANTPNKPETATTPAAVATADKPAPETTTKTETKDNRITAKVTRVVDGDTIEVQIGNKKETVRMILVDTPETKKPNTPIQPFGPEASKFTKDTLEGKEVKLEKDVSERDKYGRLLMYVWLGDQMFNEMLLEKGLARVAVFPPDVKYVDKFREIQKKAQEAGIGIWSIENYAREDGYHQEAAKKESATQAPEKPKSAPQNVYYKNCAEVRAAGKAPLHRVDPGYRSGLDRDNDGIACE